MEQIDFLNKIRNAYLKARDCSFQPKTNIEILSRGTSHSISSETEDLFGCYCVEKVSEPRNIKVIIDPPISFKGTELKNKSGKKSLLLRPDIVITKNNVANCFFDLKTDLGYKRFELLNQAKEKDELLELIKGKQAKYRDGKTKYEQIIEISENIKFVYVIISQGNINRDRLNGFIKEIRQLNNIEIFVLSEGEHLNSYSESIQLKVNSNDFTELDNLLEDKLNE